MTSATLPSNGNIPVSGIADILQTLSNARSSGSLLLVRDYDMCKLYFELGTIVHTEVTQMDPNKTSELNGEAGLRLMAKLLTWNKGMYTHNADEAAIARTVNLKLDWVKVAHDLAKPKEEPQAAPARDLRATQTMQMKQTRMTQTRTTQTNMSQVRSSGRGGAPVNQQQAQAMQLASQKAFSSEITDIPIRLKSSISGDQGPYVSQVRNKVVGRGGGTIRTRTQTEDRRSVIFRLIDNRRNIRDIAVYLAWSVEDIKTILAQLIAEDAIDIMRP